LEEDPPIADLQPVLLHVPAALDAFDVAGPRTGRQPLEGQGDPLLNVTRNTPEIALRTPGKLDPPDV